jgi:ribonuclease J
MISKYNTNNEASVRVFALGGLDENGKNMYCIETKDSIFVIEAGSKYPDLTNPGVDVIIPDMTYLKEHASKVKAIIISHGHDDEYGALPYLLKIVNVPIYTTATARIFIMADFGKKYGNLFNFHIIKPSDDCMIAGYAFHFFGTTHTVMESFGFSMETPSGSIVYTGDYISDFGVQGHFTFDLAKIAKIADEHKTLLMMTESSGADKPGIVSPTHKITPHIKGLIEEGEHRVVIACYTQNMYVISEIIALAVKNHKKIVITNSHFIDVLPQFIANGDLMIPRANQCAVDEIPQNAPTDLIVLITGSGEELYDYLEDLGHHENKDKAFQISPDDVIVLACPPVASTEEKSVAARDSLYTTGAKIVNLTRNDLSSMHAQQEDIKMLISIFHPKYYMPVEGEFRLMMANAKVAESIGYGADKIFLIDNGMALAFDAAGNAVLPVATLVRPGNVFIDGLGVGDVRSDIIDERTQMSEGGVIVLGAVFSSKSHQLVGQPTVDMKGFVHTSDSESVVKSITQIFNNALRELLAMPTPDIVLAMRRMMKTMSDEMIRQTGKNPLILPVVTDIDNPVAIDIKPETEEERRAPERHDDSDN